MLTMMFEAGLAMLLVGMLPSSSFAMNGQEMYDWMQNTSTPVVEYPHFRRLSLRPGKPDFPDTDELGVDSPPQNSSLPPPKYSTSTANFTAANGNWPIDYTTGETTYKQPLQQPVPAPMSLYSQTDVILNIPNSQLTLRYFPPERRDPYMTQPRRLSPQNLFKAIDNALDKILEMVDDLDESGNFAYGQQGAKGGIFIYEDILLQFHRIELDPRQYPNHDQIGPNYAQAMEVLEGIESEARRGSFQAAKVDIWNNAQSPADPIAILDILSVIDNNAYWQYINSGGSASALSGGSSRASSRASSTRRRRRAARNNV